MEPATAKGPPGFFGLVPQGKVPTDADIDRMARGEVGTVRLVANWALIEPTDDAWNFVALDAYIDDLAASGIRPFPVLFNTTPFVNSDGLRLPVHSGQDKEQWREFVAMVVQRYGAGGEYWKQQAKLLKRSFKLLLKKRTKWKVGGVMWSTWRDLPRGQSLCDWCSTAGRFKRGGAKPKPAWEALRPLYRRLMS